MLFHHVTKVERITNAVAKVAEVARTAAECTCNCQKPTHASVTWFGMTQAEAIAAVFSLDIAITIFLLYLTDKIECSIFLQNVMATIIMGIALIVMIGFAIFAKLYL